ncbi:MAG: hypothetical protein WCJ30_10890, partial [Deltaproteobacteria bacterium]
SMAALLEAAGTAHAGSLAPPPASRSQDEVALAETAVSQPMIDSIREQVRPSSSASIGAAPSAVTARAEALTPRASPWIAALGLCCVGIGGGLWARSRGRPPAARAAAPTQPRPLASRPTVMFDRVQRLTYDEGCEEFPSWTPDDRTIVFDAADGADYHLFALDLASGRRRAVTSGHGWQFAGAVSLDGSQVAFVSRDEVDAHAAIVPLDGSTQPRRLAAGGSRPTWSRDGGCVWVGTFASVACLDPRSGGARLRIEPSPGENMSAVYDLPDGRRIVRTVPDQLAATFRLRFYGRDLSPGLLAIDGIVEEALTLAPGDRALWVSRVAADGHAQLWEIPLEGGDPRGLSDADVRPTKGIALSHGRTHVVWSDCASGSDIGRIVAADGGSQFERETAMRDWEESQVVAIPGGSFYAVSSRRRGTFEVWVADSTGHTPARVIEGTQRVDTLAVSHDGQTIAFSQSGHGLFTVPTSGNSPPTHITIGREDEFPSFGRDDREIYFERHDPPARRPCVAAVPVAGGDVRNVLPQGTGRPSYDPSSGLLAFVAFAEGDHTGAVQLHDLATGRDRLLSTDIPSSAYGPAAFSPDGRRLAVTDYGRTAVELDVASGRVITRFDSGADQVESVTYRGSDLVVLRAVWSGDLWSADVTVR